MATVSVLIDTYNHARFIQRAIDSALSQVEIDDWDVEILVVDDGSTDETPELVARYQDRVKLIRKANGGQSSAFNIGIPQCTGKYIAFLDGDDWWHERKLKCVIEAFDERPDVVAVGHKITYVDEISGGTRLEGPDKEVEFSFSDRSGVAEFHKYAACLGTSRLAVRSEIAGSLLDVPELLFEADEYLFTLLPACGVVKVLAQPLTFYRIHGANLYHASPRDLTAEAHSPKRTLQRAEIYRRLSETLRPRLGRLGCGPEIIDIVMAPVEVSALRLHLLCHGGTRRENIALERRARALRPDGGALIDRIKSSAVLALACLLSPPRFYRLRDQYAQFRLRMQHRRP